MNLITEQIILSFMSGLVFGSVVQGIIIIVRTIIQKVF